MEESFDLLLWWLALGLPLAWKKGSAHVGMQPYECIGVRFIPTAQGEVNMELPKQLLRGFLAALHPFCRTTGAQQLSTEPQLKIKFYCLNGFAVFLRKHLGGWESVKHS